LILHAGILKKSSYSGVTMNRIDKFYKRFDKFGNFIVENYSRITTEESEKQFIPRNEGLSILLINPPIREWSYPNIMPIGLGYVGAVASIDGHRVNVLDLNADRLRPIKDDPSHFSQWVEERVRKTLETQKPDVIGTSG